MSHQQYYRVLAWLGLLYRFCVASAWVGLLILWIKNGYPFWNPSKWNQRLKPAVPWCFHFDSYSFCGLLCGQDLRCNGLQRHGPVSAGRRTRGHHAVGGPSGPFVRSFEMAGGLDYGSSSVEVTTKNGCSPSWLFGRSL